MTPEQLHDIERGVKVSSVKALRADVLALIAEYRKLPPFKCAYEQAHADTEGNCAQAFRKIEDDVKELERGLEIRGEQMDGMAEATKILFDRAEKAEADLVKMTHDRDVWKEVAECLVGARDKFKARVAVLRAALEDAATILNKADYSDEWNDAREALATLDPEATALLERLEAAEAVCVKATGFNWPELLLWRRLKGLKP